MRTLAVVNQKGGCGKTTTAINLAGVFARRGFKTLLVDMDPQGHCAAGLAIPEQRVDLHIGDAMLAADDAPVDPARLLWRVSRNLDLAPSTVRLAALEAARGELAKRDDAETRLKHVLTRFDSQYDICLIDCSPAIGMLAFNAMVAADEILIPVETGFFSLQGATKQINAIKAIGKRLGVAPPHRLLATLHDPSSVLSQDLLEELRRRFGNRVLPVVIRADQSLREAASFGQPVVEYSPESAGAKDYSALADWLIENVIKNPASATPTFDADDGTPPTPPSVTPSVPSSSPAVQVIPGIAERAMTNVRQMVGASVAGTSPTPLTPIHSESTRSASTAMAASVATNETAKPAFAATAPLPTSRAADIAGRTKKLQRAATIAEVKTPPAPAVESPLATLSTATIVPTNMPQRSAEPVTPALSPATSSAAPSISQPFGVQVRGKTMHFCLPVSIGQSVAVAGEFNGWNPERTPLRVNRQTGVLEAAAEAPAGSWQYRLVVDGRWMPDPFNPVVAPNPYGGSNSVVIVPQAAAYA